MSKKEEKLNEEINETVVEQEVENEGVGTVVEEDVANEGHDEVPNIQVDEVKEITERIDKLNLKRAELEKKKGEFDVHMNDLETIKTLYGEESKQFEAKKGVIEIADAELKKLEDEVDELSFKRSELKPYLDAATDLFDKERMAQASREYHVEIGNLKTFNQLLDFCYHAMTWTPKTAPALMTLVNNLEENKPLARSKGFDGVIMLRSGNVLALQDFMTNKIEGRGWNTAKEFLMCWANCGKNIGESVRVIQKEYEVAREYATYLQKIDGEFSNSENDIEEEEMTTKEEVTSEI